MPIYEYHCGPCDHAFETLVRGPSDVPHCPECGGIDLNKQFSVPASVHSSAGASASSLPICNPNAGPSPFGGCGAGGCGGGMCSVD